MTRILHLIGTSHIGGTEHFLVRLAERIDTHRFQTGICVLDAPGALAGTYARVADPVEHLDLGHRGVVSAIAAWRRLVNEWRPDVVVLYGSRANLLGRLVRNGTPVISALRSVVVDERGTWWAAALDRLTFGNVSLCVSNSRTALEGLLRRGYPPERLAYVSNAIDVDEFSRQERSACRDALGVPAGTRVLVCVANLKPVKGHETLLQASALLKEAGVPHVLWLIGEGPERRRLEELCARLQLTDTAVFLGTRNDVPCRLAAADIAVLTSRWEGMPTFLLEAMAAGLPVVATDVGEVGRLVRDGVFGTLVPPDDVDGLKTALMALLGDDQRRRAWGARAAQEAASFSITAVVEQYERILEWAGRRGSRAELGRLVGSG